MSYGMYVIFAFCIDTIYRFGIYKNTISIKYYRYLTYFSYKYRGKYICIYNIFVQLCKVYDFIINYDSEFEWRR